MWSILSQIEQPLLRLVLFACFAPLLWFALAGRILVDSAVEPALARVRRRRR